MHPALQPLSARDRLWFRLNGTAPVRIRPPTNGETRAADIQDPDAVAIVVKACDGDGFVILASGEAKPSREAIRDFLDTLQLPLTAGFDLARHLPRVRPETLIAASIRLLGSVPWCAGCRCSVRWTVLFAGIAHLSLPPDDPRLAPLAAAWSDFKARQGEGPEVPAAAVATASAALQEIARTA